VSTSIDVFYLSWLNSSYAVDTYTPSSTPREEKESQEVTTGRTRRARGPGPSVDKHDGKGA
jgi:hypothetical protein